MINLKQALNYGLVLKKADRVITYHQNAWLKSYIDMNTDPRKIAKNRFEKYFFKLRDNAFFGKAMKKRFFLQQKEEETIWCQNQICILKKLSQNIY